MTRRSIHNIIDHNYWGVSVLLALLLLMLLLKKSLLWSHHIQTVITTGIPLGQYNEGPPAVYGSQIVKVHVGRALPSVNWVS